MKKNIFFIKVADDENISKKTEEIRRRSKRKEFVEECWSWRGYLVTPEVSPVEGIVVCFEKERSAIKAKSFAKRYLKSISPEACTVKNLYPKAELRWSFYTEIEIGYTAIQFARMWQKASDAIESKVSAGIVRIENGKLAVFGSIESDSSAIRQDWYENIKEICKMLDIPTFEIF